jgi:hypothetical protein
VKFNLKAAEFEERYRRAVAPRLMLGHWLAYQLKRSRIAYVPALRRSGNRKRAWRMAGEMALLVVRWRCLPFHYLRYGLYERDYDLKTVLSYLPETVFYYRVLSRLNRDTVLLDDKVVCKRILGAADVPQAELLLSGEGEHSFDASGNLVTADFLASVLTEGERVVIKPARYSSGGDGVMAVIHSAGTLRGQDGHVVALQQYGATWGSWLVERFVRQHPNLAALNDRSLNTLRVITTWHPQRGAQVEYCMLKLGAGKGLVDNAHDGGLYLGVDKDSGKLSEVAFDEAFVRHSKHPLSDVTFADYKIEAIREVVALVEHAAALFPQTILIGWDIAVGETGPLIIEGNSSPGLTNVQRTHGGVAPTLGRLLAHAYERSLS